MSDLRVLHPTVLFAADPFADDVLARVTGSLERAEPLLRVRPPPADADGEAALVEDLAALLRVGRDGARTAEPRLDLVLVVDRRQPNGRPLVDLVKPLARVLADRFGGVFPAQAEHRTAGLHLVVAAPPASPAMGPLLRELAALDAAPLPWPLLSRVWLATAQTTAGVLEPEDLASSCAGFILALLGAGSRDDEAVSARLAPLGPGERYGFFAVGSLDLPVARLRAWSRTRAAWDAMHAAAERLQRHGVDPLAMQRAVSGLDVPALLAPFIDGPEATTLRARAESIPGDWTADPVVQATRATLDQADVHAVVAAERALDALLAGRLGTTHPLEHAAEVDAGLGALERQLAEGLDAEPLPLTRAPVTAPAAPRPAPPVVAPTARALTAPTTLGPAVAAGTVALGLVLGLLAAPPAAPGGLSATRVTTTAAPATGSAGLAWAGWIAAAVVIAAVAGWLSRPAPPPVAAAEPDPGPRRGRERAEAVLAVHRRRARAGVLQRVRNARRRVAVTRTALVSGRDRLTDELVRLGVPPQPDAALDDLQPLLAGTSRLHDRLVDARVAGQWLARTRRQADPAAWADRLLDRTWPAEGLRFDAPGADLDGWRAAAAAELDALDAHNLFDDDGAAAQAAERATTFLRRVVQALAPGGAPRSPLGDPLVGLRPGEILVVAPAEGRQALEPALRRAEVAMTAVWTPIRLPAVLVVRTWEGFPLAAVARGAGVPEVTP